MKMDKKLEEFEAAREANIDSEIDLASFPLDILNNL